MIPAGSPLSAPTDLPDAKALETAIGVAGNPGVAVETAPRWDRLTVDPTESAMVDAKTTRPRPEANDSPSARTSETSPPSGGLASGVATWKVSEPAEAGDVLVLDESHPGMLRLGAVPSDPGVAGIAAAPSFELDGQLAVTLVEVLHALVKVDATTAPIHPGDLLVASANPGRAMRAPAGAAATAAIGKALEGLEAGQGELRVLLGVK
jgi:hypothetical protein